MLLSKLFSSEERVRILEYVLYRNEVSVGEVSKELSLSKGLVSNFLALLYENKILGKNKRYYPLENGLSRAIKTVLNVNKIELSKIKKLFIKGIGLYGSWASGTNNIDSDLDIWIKTDKYPNEKELAQLSKVLRETVHADIQLLVLTPEKIEQLKKDEPFFSSLYYGSILLWGKPIV